MNGRIGFHFTNGAVLQRDQALPVWGTASAGADVPVTLNDTSETTQAAADGTWRTIETRRMMLMR